MAAPSDEKPTPPNLSEIAASGSEMNLSGFMAEIARPEDEVLRSIGGDLLEYERLLRDEQVYSTFQQRRRATTSTNWEVVAASESPLDEAAAAFLREQLEAINFDRATDRMLYGLFYGFAIGECLWGIDGNRVVLTGIKVRRARRFMWGADGSLRLRTFGKPGGEVMPDRKFWTFSAGSDNDDDLYGRGLGSWLYWPVYLKRNGAKFWATALEKYGGPTVLAKYPQGTNAADVNKLLQAAVAVSTDAAVAIPDELALELLESVKRSNGDFSVFIRYWDAAISKVVLSQTMTTDDGASLSQSEVHMDVRQDVVEGDADLVCESFNAGPARWLTEWNFPGAGTPKVWRMIEEEEDLTQASERDERLYRIGFVPSEDRVRDTYGDGYERKAPPAGGTGFPFQDGPPAAFAEPGRARDAVDAIADAVDGKRPLDPLIDEMRAVLDGAASLSAAQAELTRRYTTLERGAFVEILAEAMILAELTGRDAIGPDADDEV